MSLITMSCRSAMSHGCCWHHGFCWCSCFHDSHRLSLVLVVIFLMGFVIKEIFKNQSLALLNKICLCIFYGSLYYDHVVIRKIKVFWLKEEILAIEGCFWCVQPSWTKFAFIFCFLLWVLLLWPRCIKKNTKVFWLKVEILAVKGSFWCVQRDVKLSKLEIRPTHQGQKWRGNNWKRHVLTKNW